MFHCVEAYKDFGGILIENDILVMESGNLLFHFLSSLVQLTNRLHNPMLF